MLKTAILNCSQKLGPQNKIFKVAGVNADIVAPEIEGEEK